MNFPINKGDQLKYLKSLTKDDESFVKNLPILISLLFQREARFLHIHICRLLSSFPKCNMSLLTSVFHQHLENFYSTLVKLKKSDLNYEDMIYTLDSLTSPAVLQMKLNFRLW